MDEKSLISRIIKNNVETNGKILEEEGVLTMIEKIAGEMIGAFRNGKKVLLCGNGGSAADAQHIAAELGGKFYLDRDPLFAEALHGNSSYLTAVANDYSYDEVFVRAVRAMGKEKDILIGISTSGNSLNVIKAIEAANKLGMITIGFTGETGGKIKDVCKYIIKVPSSDTPRIQEAHILIGHIVCEIVEKEIFGKKHIKEI
ncbi:MAG: phosphoheptose isomerase [Candidatus Nealsonbacteria bacterium RBG_13_42_11]|uniref:Phosphoheptose isomerase n=1 Tax=Candidatus Nealsonbacteria bacterium RBG_13_42_11 TaxID=1801663 RepID=A0A1G2DZ96_9BACT|nr:MAG: phosphoheptose isomerase [Candidatus Nealsonbacteria bacterium RBG_13_42_11]